MANSKLKTRLIKLYNRTTAGANWGQGLTRMKLESRMNKIVPYPLGCKIESFQGPIYKKGNEHQKWDNLYTKRCTTPSIDDNASGVAHYKVGAIGYHLGMTK